MSDNVEDEMTVGMSPEARAVYETVIRDATLRYGELAEKHPSTYGWTAPWEEVQHAKRCGLVPGTEVRETSWSEFMGTFYEGDTSKHGIIAYGVSCTCGQITGREVRWEMTAGDMIPIIMSVLCEHIAHSDRDES